MSYHLELVPADEPHGGPAPWDALSQECVPLDDAPDDDPMRFLAHDGIDHTTGLDSLFSPTHDGVLLCAGFAMMENEDD